MEQELANALRFYTLKAVSSRRAGIAEHERQAEGEGQTLSAESFAGADVAICKLHQTNSDDLDCKPQDQRYGGEAHLCWAAEAESGASSSGRFTFCGSSRGLPKSPYYRPGAIAVVASMPPRIAASIGSTGGDVLMSVVTAQKQALSHPELGASDYREVIQAFNECLVVKEGRNGYTRHLLFLVKRGTRFAWRWWKAAIKATEDGSELYLVTLHPLEAREIEPIVEQGVVVRAAQGSQRLTPFTPSQCIF